MKLTDLLTYLGNPATFPFFGGWVTPPAQQGAVQSFLTTNGVVMITNPSPSGDQVLTAFYRKIVGNSCVLSRVQIYCARYNTADEAAYLAAPAPAKPKNTLTFLGISSALGSPAVPLAIYAQLITAATATPSNPLAAAVAPLIAPGGLGLDFYDPATIAGIAILVAENLITAEQQAALAPLSVIPSPTDFQ